MRKDFGDEVFRSSRLGINELDVNEFKTLLNEVDSSLRSLPPTAQVAGQQGSFLAATFNGETEKPFRCGSRGVRACLRVDGER